MRTSRPAYLMAMLAGLVIVGASTGGAAAATHHHDQTVAAAQAQPTSAPADDAAPVPGSALPASTVAAAPSSVDPVPSTAPESVAASSAVAPSPAPAGSSTSSTTHPTGATTPTPSAARTTRATPTPVVAAQKFRDGTYSATGSYNSPGGIEKLGVTLTLSGDKVTKSDLDLLGGAGLSHSFQSAFASGYSGQVIGKDISTIKLGAVSGSSLTGMGFNAALQQIETQAKAAG